jgi:drug/metabolite transporter (DMT)-like permease
VWKGIGHLRRSCQPQCLRSPVRRGLRQSYTEPARLRERHCSDGVSHLLAGFNRIGLVTSSQTIGVVWISTRKLFAQPLGPITPVIGVGLLYIGVVASVAAFMAWSTGIRGVGAARGAIFVNLIPLFTAGIAVLTLGERFGLVQLIGGLLVIGGVTLASSRGWERADGGQTMSPATK